MQLVNAGEEEEELHIPPPLKEVAELPENVQLVSAGEDARLNSPPPHPEAKLRKRLQFVTAGEDSRLYTPAPSRAELPEKAQFATAGEDSPLHIPPPMSATLLEKVQSVTDIVEPQSFEIPPPQPVVELSEKVHLVTTGDAPWL